MGSITRRTFCERWYAIADSQYYRRFALDKYYIHSNCCNAHWEIVVNENNVPELQCEKCGKPTESGVLICFTENIEEVRKSQE